MELKCIKSVKNDKAKCLRPCSGLIVTGYHRIDDISEYQDIEHYFLEGYNHYKKVTQAPSAYKGKLVTGIV